MCGWPDTSHTRAGCDDPEEEEGCPQAFVRHAMPTHARCNTACDGITACNGIAACNGITACSGNTARRDTPTLIDRALVMHHRRPFTNLFTKLSDEAKTSFLELTKKMRLAKALPKDQKHAQTKALDMEVHRLLGPKYAEYKAAAGKGKSSKGVSSASTAASPAAAAPSAATPSTTATSASPSAAAKKKKSGILKTGAAKKTKSSKPKKVSAPAAAP